MMPPQRNFVIFYIIFYIKYVSTEDFYTVNTHYQNPVPAPVWIGSLD
jgi:hypothetical protein